MDSCERGQRRTETQQLCCNVREEREREQNDSIFIYNDVAFQSGGYHTKAGVF